MVILWFSGGTIGLSLVAVPAILTAMFVFVLAVSYFVAALNVVFRDMQYIVPILLQLGDFATPIFYDVTNLPEATHAALSLNPMLQFIEAFRAVLMRDEWPNWIALSLVLVASFIALAVAQRIFRRASLRFLEEL